MSLLGIDVGTTAAKVAAFSVTGDMIASASTEYDPQRPRPEWAELDAVVVLSAVKRILLKVVTQCGADPVTALAVSSMGEAVVPVSADRVVLGPSILNFDERGSEYVEPLRAALGEQALYRINGNIIGNHYGLTKLKWIQDHEPELYERADKFLLWSSFVAFMLGAGPVVDYSLANRTLLFDLEQGGWSDYLLRVTGLDRGKLPAVVPSGCVIGTVRPEMAAEVGLGPGVTIVSGAHDQCANAVGCGVVAPGHAVYGMGTFICITPVFDTRREPAVMIERGLNTEHHAVPHRLVSFIYNQGGSSVKWFRDTFAHFERKAAERAGEDAYNLLFAEMPEGPSPVLVRTDFADAPFGLIRGVRLTTTRGDILKGIVEGTTFDLRARIERLPPTGIEIDEYCAAGGGSKSTRWIQIAADIIGRPFVRSRIAEAGALGAAIIAGVGSGVFATYEEAVSAMVRPGEQYEPNAQRQQLYLERFQEYLGMRRL